MRHLKGIMAIVVFCAFTACGGGGPSEDISKAFRALSSTDQNTVMSVIRSQVRSAQSRARTARDEMTLKKYGLTGSSSVRAASEGVDCGIMTIEGGTCTSSACDVNSQTDLHMAGSCTLDGEKLSCGGESFTYSNGRFDYDVRLDGTVVTFDMSLSSDVTGGDLDGKVACDVDYSIDFSDTGAEAEMDCGNVSCKYDGESIDCDDLQDAFSEDGSSC